MYSSNTHYFNFTTVVPLVIGFGTTIFLNRKIFFFKEQIFFFVTVIDEGMLIVLFFGEPDRALQTIEKIISI